VETAENGRRALEKLRTDSFDLVLLDIEMPEMNGYQVLETCLQDPELRDIPIIMNLLDELIVWSNASNWARRIISTSL
jgi:CheY-like chemotaxis protein